MHSLIMIKILFQYTEYLRNEYFRPTINNKQFVFDILSIQIFNKFILYFMTNIYDKYNFACENVIFGKCILKLDRKK